MARGRHVARVRCIDAPLPSNGEKGNILVVRGAGRATVAARRMYTRRRQRGIDEEKEAASGMFRDARSVLRAAIRKAKADAWRELVSSLDRDPWRRPYKIVTKKLRPWALMIAETLNARFLENVMAALFATTERDIPERAGPPSGWRS